AHANDSDIHVTSSEKSTWNNKAEKSDIKDGKFKVKGVGALQGEGETSANADDNTDVELDLTEETKDEISKGVEAHGWGNHASAGYATEEFVEDAIDDIEIGGRNYLPDSRFIKSNQEAINWRRLPSETSVQVEDGIAIYTRLKDYNAARLERPVYLEKGIYTYSMRAKSEFSFNMDLSYVEYLKKVSVPSNDFTIHYAVIKVVNEGMVYLNFRYPSASIMPVGSQFE